MSNDLKNIFHKVPVEINNKSGFDMSHFHRFTAKCGTITPVLSQFLNPGDKVSLSHSFQVNLPPMVTDFYGRIACKCEAFFVPCRLLYGGFQQMMTHFPDGMTDIAGDTHSPVILPNFSVQANKSAEQSTVLNDNVKPGSLLDYLGLRVTKIGPLMSEQSVKVNIPNILKVVAYHKIYDDWYRDARIQKPLFRQYTPDSDLGASGDVDHFFDYLPHFTYTLEQAQLSRGLPLNSPDHYHSDVASFFISDYFGDYSSIWDLRQRNWSRDYFTNATPLPQGGEASRVIFETNDNSGSFTIASLRQANALQKWLERNQIAGYRYGDQIKARFGVYPSDAVLQRPVYLGSSTIDVYNKSVYQNTPTEGGSNPFGGVGARYANPLGVGRNTLVPNFEAKEYGYLFVNFTLVPYAAYSNGVDRHFSWSEQTDFPDPMFAGVGDQEILQTELHYFPNSSLDSELNIHDYSGGDVQHTTTFGYTQRFADSKFINDKVSGLLVDGQSLDSFALQRSFGIEGTDLGTEFIQIPQNYLDQVSTVGSEQSQFGCWVDMYFDFKKSSLLPAYSIPTLGDEKNTHTEVIDNGGQRL